MHENIIYQYLVGYHNIIMLQQWLWCTSALFYHTFSEHIPQTNSLLLSYKVSSGWRWWEFAYNVLSRLSGTLRVGGMFFISFFLKPRRRRIIYILLSIILHSLYRFIFCIIFNYIFISYKILYDAMSNRTH